MGKKFTILIVALVVVILGVFGYLAFFKSKSVQNRIYHVGILSGIDAFSGTGDSFIQKMTSLGYIQGQNIDYDFQKVNDNPAEEERILKMFVAKKVDLIVPITTSSAVTAKKATVGTRIPVIFANAGVEGNDLIQSLKQPGSNISGVRFPGWELTVKRLEFLHEILPHAKRVYVSYDQSYPGISFTLDKVREAAITMNLTLVEVPVSGLDALKTDLANRTTAGLPGFDAVLVMPTLLTVTSGFDVLMPFANTYKIPVAGSTKENAQAGAIFSYIPENSSFGDQAAVIADEVIRGTPVGTIPIESPEAYFTINSVAAQKLGLKFPEGIISRANEILR